MNSSWMVTSPKEHELGTQFAEAICAHNRTQEECVQALALLPDQCRTAAWDRAFAQREDEITNNVLAQAAYSISEIKKWNHGKGAVLTPNILAEDMVRMSLIEWISIHCSFEKDEIMRFACGIMQDSMEAAEDLRDLIRSVAWYDPCVGGGAYPLAVAEVYRKLGILEYPKICGCDVNPLYVEATIQRLALYYGKDAEPFYRSRIICRDALSDRQDRRMAADMPGQREAYDIVIGNPPYVRAESVEAGKKKDYLQNYPEAGGKNADLYVYFIAHGLRMLKKDGVLTFVTPAQFQSSSYGEAIRRVIQNQGNLCAIADFNELPVFKNIGIHTSVYTIAKNKNRKEFLRYEYDTLPQKHPLALLYSKGMWLTQENASEQGWIFSSSGARSILNFLERRGIPLKEYSGGVFSGIKTGCKKAFFMTESDLEGFDSYDYVYCKRMIVPKKIKKWRSAWDGDYLALIKKDEKLDERSKIYFHMAAYQKDLQARTDIEGHKTWYGLRPCAYYDLFFLPKIIFPDISAECRFSMDRDSLIIPDGAFFIPGEDYYLLGILNSCIGRYYFKQKCARIGNPMKGGRIRFKKVYVETFPVMRKEEDLLTAREINVLAKRAVDRGGMSDQEKRELDRLALKMYQIPAYMKNTIQEELDAV